MVRMINQNRRNQSDRCRSCNAKKQQKVQDCIPWHGHFGMDMVTPIDENGNPILRGKRRCGNLDCVNPKHIERMDDGNRNN